VFSPTTITYYDFVMHSQAMPVFRNAQFFTVVFLLCCHAAFAQPDWEARAEANAKRLIENNGTGRDLHLKRELLKMRDEDQSVRNTLNAAPEAQKPAVTKEMESIDVRLTGQLKGIVAEKGWPTISLVGAEASQAAATILVHSADHDWQRRMLPLLHRLVKENKIFGSDVAGLTDRILVAEGKRQEFGTQFKQVDGKMVMMPVKDLKHLEQRRAKYLLPPMPVYRQLISDMYHLPAE
jgi:hypothetical protein